MLDEAGPLARRQLGLTLLRLVGAGLRNVLLFGPQSQDVEKAIAGLASTVAFVAREASPGASGLPPGPEIVIVGVGAPLREAHLGARPGGQERVLIVPSDIRSPGRPHVLLSQCHNGRILTLRELYGRLIA